jgi:hypothetical protein
MRTSEQFMPPRAFPPPPATLQRVALIAQEDPAPDPDPTLSIPEKRFDDRISPRWLRIPAATAYSGINRNRLYRLISEGVIKTACLKEHRGAKRGLRLIDRFSLDLFLEKLSKPFEEQLVAESDALLVQEQELVRQQELLTKKRRAITAQLARIHKGNEV